MSDGLPWVPELWLPRSWQRSRAERLLRMLAVRAPHDVHELERAVALGHRAWERPPAELVAPTMALAARRADAGRLLEAANLYARAADVAAAQFPKGHPCPARAAADRARTLARADRHAEAERTLSAWLDATGQAPGAALDPVARATLLFGSADVARHAGELDRADARLGDALGQLDEPLPSADSAPYRQGVPSNTRPLGARHTPDVLELGAELTLRLGELALTRHQLGRARMIFGHVVRRYGACGQATELRAQLGLCQADLLDGNWGDAAGRLAVVDAAAPPASDRSLALDVDLSLVRADLLARQGLAEASEQAASDLLHRDGLPAAPRVEALLRLATAARLQGASRAAEAVEISREALDTARRAGLDPDLFGSALAGLGRALLDLGEDQSAREALEAARQIARARHGPEHPRARPLAEALRHARA